MRLELNRKFTSILTPQEFRGAFGLTVKSTILLDRPRGYCIEFVFHVKQ